MQYLRVRNIVVLSGLAYDLMGVQKVSLITMELRACSIGAHTRPHTSWYGSVSLATARSKYQKSKKVPGQPKFTRFHISMTLEIVKMVLLEHQLP